jgi:NAD(P)-dependent dehydrogenase (short-subunit alcohol dehydrogenase family)
VISYWILESNLEVLMAARLIGRTALVTGATGGIGRAVARALAADGALVVLTGRDRARGASVLRAIEEAGGRAAFVAADLSAGAPAVQRLADEARAAAGGTIDILVNNAAALVPAQSLHDASAQQLDEVLTMNVKVPFLLTAALAPGMAERGRGVIINMGSINGTVGMAVAALYGASKAALHSLTKSWAAELGPLGIRVNTVAPGPTRTELNDSWGPMLDELAGSFPARRPGTADEVAAVVAFLASDQASYVQGATIPVDGGATTR